MQNQENDGQRQFPSNFTGTVKRAPHFNPEKDAGALHGFLRGIVNDETSTITILSSRTNVQRLEISRSYSAVYDRNLLRDLKAETSGDFENLLVALMQDPVEYDVACLHRAMKGLGTDEKTLTEILVTRPEEEILKITSLYQRKYGHDLTQDIADDASGGFRKLLVTLASGSRGHWTDAISASKSREDAEMLRTMKQSGAFSTSVGDIFCTSSFPQLLATFSEYEKISQQDILKTISSGFNGDLKHALKTIVQVARHPPTYFAQRLYRSMKGLGTDDTTLIRVIVSRSEIDMLDIKRCFEEKYGKSLERYIEGDTSGCYKKLLLALVSS